MARRNAFPLARSNPVRTMRTAHSKRVAAAPTLINNSKKSNLSPFGVCCPYRWVLDPPSNKVVITMHQHTT
jgi:hypothetical protein